MASRHLTQFPNLQFLEGRENESKNKTPLKDWIAQGNSIEFMPNGVSLEQKDFDTFFEKRRKLIKAELMKIFNIPTTSSKSKYPLLASAIISL